MCEINNPLGDPDDQEYGLRAVYVIDDGERHWHVGSDAGKALSGYVSLMDPDGEEYTVRRLLPSAIVTVNLEGREDFANYPPEFERLEPDDENQGYRVRAYAAMWARHAEEGEQICSTCF